MFVLFFGLLAPRVYSQSPVNIDSLEATHPPGKAVLRSAVLPGLGQAYNRKYWKIPVLYAGAGTLIYFARFNNTEYKRFKLAYGLRIDGDTATVDEFADTGLQAADLSTQKNYWRRNRDLCYIGLTALYIINIIDAYIDAHLFYFKVTDELTMRLAPGAGMVSKASFAGINLQLTF